MIRIRPSPPRDAAEGYLRRTAHIESASGIEDVWFVTPAGVHPLTEDWLLPVGIVIGMALGEDVHIVGCVSGPLLASMPELQYISALRHDGLKEIRITAEEITQPPPAERARVVSCFSCGVDSFYTALDPDLRIDEHLYVHGLEARVGDERMLAHALPHIRAASVELGRPLRLAETNWRTVVEPLVGHDFFVSIPILFAIAHLMGSDVARFVVPSTDHPGYPPEHPLSEKIYTGMWGTEQLVTVEHGHVPRLEKVRRLTSSDVAMRHLRVCWQQTHPSYNCGRCIKCVRMRTHLRLAGAEGRCETLPRRIGLDEIRRTSPERIAPDYLNDNIAEAESQGLTDLAAALRFQRDQSGKPLSWRHAPRAKAERWFTNLHLSYRKRRFDVTLRRLKRRRGHDHLFNCLGPKSV